MILVYSYIKHSYSIPYIPYININRVAYIASLRYVVYSYNSWSRGALYTLVYYTVRRSAPVCGNIGKVTYRAEIFRFRLKKKEKRSQSVLSFSRLVIPVILNNTLPSYLSTK